MQDAENDYPVHQPQRQRGNGHQDIFDDQTEPELERDDRRSSRRRPPYEREEATTLGLPQGRVRNATFAGVIAGFLCAAQSIAITVANASTYQAFAVAKEQTVKSALAFTILGYAVLTFVISMLICLIAGFIIGKASIQRRLGFLTGFVAGIVTYGISFLLNFIPSYPGHLVSSGPTNAGIVAGSLIIALIFFLVWGVVGGLVSLLGAWLATRHHPYYVGY